LLRDPGVDGLKTGHTEAAGYCLVASAQRDGMRLIATLLGTDSEQERARSGRRLLDFGFRKFETRLLYRSDVTVATLPVWQGENDAVALGVNQDVWFTLPRGGFTAFRALAATPQTRLAPVMRGETLGRLELVHNGQPLAELPLVHWRPCRRAALPNAPPTGYACGSGNRVWFRPHRNTMACNRLGWVVSDTTGGDTSRACTITALRAITHRAESVLSVFILSAAFAGRP